MHLSTHLKVTVGYTLLITLLLSSVYYIYRQLRVLTTENNREVRIQQQKQLMNDIVKDLYQAEILAQTSVVKRNEKYEQYHRSMGNIVHRFNSLSATIQDKRQRERIDTIQKLLRQKDANMLALTAVLRAGDSERLYRQYIKEMESQQQLLIQKRPVVHTTITHQDSYTIRSRSKKLLKRIAEVFSPKKGDTISIKKTTLEQSTDTLRQVYNPSDTVAGLLKTVRHKVAHKQMLSLHKVRNKIQALQTVGLQLGNRINGLLSDLTKAEQMLWKERDKKEQAIRNRSLYTMAGIGLTALCLAILFLIIIWRDITRSNRYRKELEEANRHTKDLLIIREKLMQTITHDIKAPASSILGYIELADNLTDNKRMHLYLGNMKNATSHLLQLIKSLLDFYRLEANKIEMTRAVFNPEQLFREIYQEFIPLCQSKQLRFDFSPDFTDKGECFEGDPFRIRQVTENLLSNAYKFTEKGYILLSVRERDKLLSIEVSDSGSGISNTDKLQIFQEFSRLPNAQGHEGFGLGLAITNRLVHLLGGKIEVESEEGKGSTFRIHIPVVQSAARFEEKKQKTKALPASLHIIYIDDDPIQLQMTASLLEHASIKVICCQSAEQVCDKLDNGIYDLLLTDIEMPEINGFQLLKLLQENYKRSSLPPVVAITGRDDLTSTYYIEKGFAACLHKPFTKKELLETIANIANKKNTPTAFNALTAFADNDPQAAVHIMETFISETHKSLKVLDKALQERNRQVTAQIAHKLLPTITLLGREDCTDLLKQLEDKRDGDTFDKQIEEATASVMNKLKSMVEEAERYKKSLFVKRS